MPGANSSEFRDSRSKKKILEIKEKFLSKQSKFSIYTLSNFPSSEFTSLSKIIFSFPYFLRNYSDEFLVLQESLNPKTDINKSTVSHFSKVWFRNYFINLEISLNRENTGFLFDSSLPFTGKDVLFVGAAPILEEQIDWIRTWKNHFFILSSDTSCNTLIANGIIPDYIVSVDAGRGTMYHFRNIPVDIPIITWLGGNSNLYHLTNPILIYLSSYPLDQVLNSVLFSGEENVFKNPSLNVAGLSKSIAEKYNAKRLILSGISFKAQSGKSHARGTGYENFNLPRIDRYFSLESYNPKIYQKDISSKNQLALYHLMESSSIKIEKPEIISEMKLDTAIYKTKPLSLKVTKKDYLKFKKIVNNLTIQKEITKEAKIDLKYFKKFINSRYFLQN